MKRSSFLVVACLLFVPLDYATAKPGTGAQQRVTIVVQADSEPTVHIAAEELASGLSRAYPAAAFSVSTDGDGGDRVIYIGTSGQLGELAPKDRLHGPESYVVTTAERDGKPIGLIVGSDARGVLYGVYGLLEELGFGYLLDGDIPPAPRDRFDLKAWDLSDRPLVPRRFVFNWHNFLSGCSSWNLEDWNRWTTQSQKMGYNGIMVHAYGNNPMVGFSFKGVDKPVGYLSSTRIGRDWSTMHVNDVRRLIGGEVFDSPVFGSSAAIDGTDAERTAAAQALMGQVFEYAEQRGVDVIIALDIDTGSANPQELIDMLPESARFKLPTRGFHHKGPHQGDYFLVRPDTPEGYGYYKAQLAHLLKVYPGMDTFVLWFRIQGTPVMGLKLDEIPTEWQVEYKRLTAEHPEAEKYWRSIGIFIVSKMVHAHQQALKELGREDVTLGVGSWGFNLQDATDFFLPKEVGIYPLDYEVLWKESRLESPGGPEGVAKTAAHRPVYPIHWAHHDDLTYVGPPYPPVENFYDLLHKSECHDSGYGVLHWTTRPLDLFFIGLSDSVWASSKNQSIEATCDKLARDLLGEEHEKVFGEYLRNWLADLPMIGRDTLDYFIDRELKGYDEALATHIERMKLLESIEMQELSPDEQKRVRYFIGLEKFILGIYQNEALYRHALALQKEGDIDGAREAIQKTRVPAVIRHYADTSKLLGISRGEKGLIVSLNLRWLVHYTALKQQLGIEPVRINFAPTNHDPLAQSRGRFTYFIDHEDRLWEVRGEEELKAPAYGQLAGGLADIPADTDALWAVRESGVVCDQPLNVVVSPLMNRKHQKIAAGRYRLTLLFGESDGSEPSMMDVSVRIPGRREPVTREISLDSHSLHEVFDVQLTEPGVIHVIIKPISGDAKISGVMLEPLP